LRKANFTLKKQKSVDWSYELTITANVPESVSSTSIYTLLRSHFKIKKPLGYKLEILS